MSEAVVVTVILFATHVSATPPLTNSEKERLGLIVEKIYTLEESRQMPQRIRLLDSALAIVGKEDWPDMWAALQSELGNSYLRSSAGDPEDNLESAIRHFRLALDGYSRANEDWAETAIDLASAYARRRRGVPEENTAGAIYYFEEALTVYTRADHPADWARVQYNWGVVLLNKTETPKSENIEQALEKFLLAMEECERQTNRQLCGAIYGNLANIYRQRTHGTKAENIERAIDYNTKALTFFTRDCCPADWARIQNHLGIAYRHREIGPDTANIEEAIRRHNLALEVLDPDVFPGSWARCKYNLGKAYSVRLKGSRSDNIEHAIENIGQAIKVSSPHDDVKGYAEMLGNLGYAYYNRMQGDRMQNLETALDIFRDVLTVFELQTDRESWARTHFNLGDVYSDRLTGPPRANLEQAVLHYDSAMLVFTEEEYPTEWVNTTMNLAWVYARLQDYGRKDANRIAIDLLESARRVVTLEDRPGDWSRIQCNLSTLYPDRRVGRKGDNVEDAISLCYAALAACPPQSYPDEWGDINYALANLYGTRVYGEPTSNTDSAINHFYSALQVRDRYSDPVKWADCISGLAVSLAGSASGDLSDNIETAISLFHSALNTVDQGADPSLWATLQNNLAAALLKRVQGDHDKSVEEAIERLQLAQQVHTRDRRPIRWATLETSIAGAYGESVGSDREKNLQSALAHARSALEVLTKHEFPLKWASVHVNMAKALANLRSDGQSELAQDAIAHLDSALSVLTLEDHPEQWAVAHHDLAAAYLSLSTNDGEDYDSLASYHYGQALEYFTEGSHPLTCARIKAGLARRYLLSEAWDRVVTVCSEAERAMEGVVSSGLQRKSRSIYRFKVGDVYQCHAYALAKLGRTVEAFETLERGRVSPLIEDLLYQEIIASPASTDMKDSLISLRLEIISHEQSIDAMRDVSTRAYRLIADDLRVARSRYQRILHEQAQRLEPEGAAEWNFERARMCCRESDAAIVSLNPTQAGTLALILVPGESRPTALFLESPTVPDILRLMVPDPGRLHEEDTWFGCLPFDEDNWPNWLQCLPGMLSRLGNDLWPSVDSILETSGVKRAILVPDELLSPFPLHATPFRSWHNGDDKTSEVYPIEKYTLVYAPSLQLYDLLSNRPSSHTKANQALFLENPEGDLSCESYLDENKERRFQDFGLTAVSLRGRDVISEEVLKHLDKAVLVHYFGHAQYDPVHPERSGLRIWSSSGEQEILTVERLELALDAQSVELAVLSSCVSGVTDIFHPQLKGRYTGLPGGFMLAGARGVVGSLWPVKPFYTCLLFDRFYDELLSADGKVCPAEALRRAQVWLLRSPPGTIEEAADGLLGIKQGRAKEGIVPREQPSGHPATWAAFTLVGAGFEQILDR